MTTSILQTAIFDGRKMRQAPATRERETRHAIACAVAMFRGTLPDPETLFSTTVALV